MAARESFEQSQLASQIGIGYGEAQVLPDRAALIEQTRANKAKEEIARGKLKAKQDKVDKDKRKELTPKFPTGIATPLQYSVNKDIKDIYLGLAESYDSPDYEQKKIEAMYRIGVITEEAKNLTNDYNTAYEFHEENKGEQKFSDSYGESALYGTSIDENPDATYEEVAEKMRKNIGDMRQHYTPQGFTQIATTLKPQVSEMTEKGKTTWVGEGGAILSSETEEFPIEKANDLIFRNISQATNANDWLQSGLAAMSDDQKKAYGTDLNGVAQWWADENDEKFVIDVTKGTRTKPVPDKEGSKKKELILPQMESGVSPTMHLTEAMKADEREAVKGDVAVVNQIGFSEKASGEDESFAITTGKYFDAETGDWVSETNKYIFTPTTIQDFQTWNGDEGVEVTVGGEKIKYKKGDYIPVEAANSLTQDQMANLGWTMTLEGVIERKVGEDQNGPILENKIIRIPKTEENVSSYSSLRSNRAMYDLYLKERGLDQYAPTSGGTKTGGGASKFNK